MGLEVVDRCPICNNHSFYTWLTCQDNLFSHEPFELQKCSSCSFLITNPRPDAESLPAYYQSSQYISHSGKSPGPLGMLYLLARRFTVRWKVGLLRQFKNPGTILDYGCGTGEFLNGCKKRGWQIAGLEPAMSARQKAADLTGIKIATHITELAPHTYDVITLWHVLEHIADLKSTIAQLKTLLKAQGLLLIAVPNYESHDAVIYHQHWAGYDVPRHLWHFSKNTMTALLQQEGLILHSILP